MNVIIFRINSPINKTVLKQFIVKKHGSKYLINGIITLTMNLQFDYDFFSV